MPLPATAAYHWATGSASYRVPDPISTARQDLGIADGDAADPLLFNSLLGNVTDWTVFLSQFATADGDLRASRILPLTGGTNTIIYIEKTTAPGTQWDTGLYFLTAGQIGFEASEAPAFRTGVSCYIVDPTWGHRYSYTNPTGTIYLLIEIDVSLSSGGYAPGFSGGGAVYLDLRSDETGSLYNSTAGAENCFARRPLMEIVHNLESPTAQRYEVTELTSSWASGTTSTLSLIERDRTTGTPTAILTVDGTTPTDTNGGTPIILDTDANVYFMEFYHAALGATTRSSVLELASLKVRKYAVE